MKLLDQACDKIHRNRYAIRTEQACVKWIRRFVIFVGKRHPKDMGEKEISQYFSHPACSLKVALSISDEGLSVLVSLYRQALGI